MMGITNGIALAVIGLDASLFRCFGVLLQGSWVESDLLGP